MLLCRGSATFIVFRASQARELSLPAELFGLTVVADVVPAAYDSRKIPLTEAHGSS